MVEQFNLKSSKRSSTELAPLNITISSPIVEDQEIQVGDVPIGGGTATPPLPESVWNNSPLFRTESSSEEDVPELIRNMSQGGLKASDTMSSDMIVNSISTGVWCVGIASMLSEICLYNYQKSLSGCARFCCNFSFMY